MILSQQEAREVVWDEHEDWKEVENKLVSHSRWSLVYEGVFLHKPSNKYYSLTWSNGAAEQQGENTICICDERPLEYEKEVAAIQVVQVEKVVKVWEKV